MIDERTQELLAERLVNRIEQLNEEILTIIGKRIKEIGKLTPSQAHQIEQILVYDKDINKIMEKLSKITELNINDIYNIMEEQAKVNQDFAKQFYEARGVHFVPFSQNKELQKQVKAIAKITADKYRNLCNTRAIGYTIRDKNNKIVFKNISNIFQETLDNAILNVTQGKTTYSSEMSRIIKQIGTSGLRTIDYESGYSRRLDSAVRMNVLGGMRDLTNELQEQFGKEFNADGIEISVHQNPAPDHAPIQGHQFSNKEYENIQNSRPFKDYQGRHYEALDRHISEYNCYHYIFSIVLGVSKQQYNNTQLQEILSKNENGAIIDGTKYTNYEITQLQRQIETKIREQKDIQILAKASGDKDTVLDAQTRITQLTNKYRQISRESGIPTKMDRLKVSGYRRINVDKI